MSAGPPVVEAHGLSVRRDGRPLLDSVDLAVAGGTIHAIIGPNGAGKSTMLSALLGQTRFSGTVRMRLRDDRALGFVPQTMAVDGTLPLTVIEFLALRRQRRPVCLGVAADVAARCAKLLDRVELGGFGRRALGALSGGELRRVLIANALDPAPDLLVLDEPSTGLDRGGVKMLEALLIDLREESGATVLLVSHDAPQVRRLADRVTWIDQTVRADGSVPEVFGESTSFPFAAED